jgi:hypothetical protein
VKVKLLAKITSAQEVNLMEDSGRELSIVDNTLYFDLRPYEIKTFKLQLRRLRGC